VRGLAYFTEAVVVTRREHAALEHALEALEDGDLEDAAATLVALRGETEAKLPRRLYRCGSCPAEYRWPGELSRHIHLFHIDQAEAA
jgi:hypothetical protein